MRNYTLYNVTGTLINKPCKILTIQTRGIDDAFILFKRELSSGLREQLGLTAKHKISFTELKSDESVGYGNTVKFTTCSIEDDGGFVMDVYEYAIWLGV